MTRDLPPSSRNSAFIACEYFVPNWKMWPDLMKVVDGVTSMGYEQTGKGSTNGFNYADQKKHAAPDKLMIGFVEALTFIGILVMGYMYAWRKKALEWR